MSPSSFGVDLGVKRVGVLAGASAPTVASAAVPVALLPVGIETRFRGDDLLVRVIPDEVHVQDHEPGLTDGEVAVGRAFWRRVWRGGTAEPGATETERAAWVALVGAVGNPRRAAWIADQTEPPAAGRPAAPVAADQPLTEPVFPDPETRASAWTRAAVAGSLPDAFVAIAYRKVGTGGTASWTEIARAWGEPIDAAVQLGLDPSASAPAVGDDGPALPDGMKWMTDPAAASAAGLLITVPLPAGTERVDRLVVLGVAQSVDAATGAGRLADLLAGHHYTRGFEVMQVGTPTNNTAATRSGFTRLDDPVASFDVERRTAAPTPGTDGAVLAAGLGIPAETLRGVGHADDAELAAGGHMNALVWPTAFGYWFDSLVQPGPDDQHIADIRDHAVRMVRGRGPLPPLRIGRQPYGVLPVTSLQRWQPWTEPVAVAQVARILRTASSWWLDGVSHAPVVRAGADPDHGMLDVLGQAAVSTVAGVRSMVGANVSYIPNQVVTTDDRAAGLAAEGNRQRWMALLGLRALGYEGFPYLGQLVAGADPIALLHLPYTVDAAAAPADRQAAWQAIVAYLRALRTRATADLQAEDPLSFTSLLTLVAHRSAMLERLRTGVRDTFGTVAGRLVEAHMRIADSPAVDAGLIATTATLRIGDTRSTTAAILAGSLQRTDGVHVQLPDYLDGVLLTNLDVVRNHDYAATVQAAEVVAGLAPDRAALLLGEALDVASHRFDAWVTSLATRRLSDLRTATPTGVTLGAYGIVEELQRAAARPTVASPPSGVPTPLSLDASGGGFIHAPSFAQAATAAVLRSGHLSHATRDPNSAALAIDLSSSRVRIALELLDGVREGQPLGALLGYRLERQLHELGAHTAVEVVRALAPPPVVTATGSPEGIPPRAVCDGLALSRLERATVLQAVQVAGVDGVAVTTALGALDDAVDAVADLLLAEGVHQIVVGNPERAAAALDALNRGDGAIPEPAVVSTPRTGTSLTHRVLVAIGADAPAAPGWPVDGARATAEPLLAAWAGHLLGDPSGLAFTVHSPAPADGAAPPAPVSVTLADLAAGALDVVYEPLLPRVLRHARRLGATPGATVELAAGPAAPMLTMGELLNGLLVRARAGTGLDLARPQDRGAVVVGPAAVGDAGDGRNVFQTASPDVDRGARAARLAAARQLLSVAITALPASGGAAPDEAAITAPLDVLASFGLHPSGDPADPISADALAALRASASQRLDAATAAPEDAAALFGQGFPVLALAAPPARSAFAAAVDVDPLTATAPDALAALGGRDAALASWIETHGRVRPGVGRLADVLLAGRLRGTDAGSLQVAQLPTAPFPDVATAQQSSWVGVAFPGELGAEPVTSFVLHTLGTIAPAAGIGVLAVDEFVEVVPSPATTTALSFGFDAPGTRPPQSVLLAVPPVPGQDWTIDALAEVVGETVDLAKMRMVDLSSVAWAGRFVPTIYLTDGDVGKGLDLPVKSLVTKAYQQLLQAHP